MCDFLITSDLGTFLFDRKSSSDKKYFTWFCPATRKRNTVIIYEEIYYNVPTRTTLNVHRRSLNKIVINDSGDELSECNAIRSDDIGILHNQISIDQEDDDDVKINNNNSNDAKDDLNTKLSPDRILYFETDELI